MGRVSETYCRVGTYRQLQRVRNWRGRACAWDDGTILMAAIMDIRKLGQSMGAEITGVDLRGLDDASFGQIHQAFLAHQVIVVREQSLTPDVQIAFSLRFGPLEDQLNAHYTVEGYPEVLLLSNDLKNGK